MAFELARAQDAHARRPDAFTVQGPDGRQAAAHSVERALAVAGNMMQLPPSARIEALKALQAGEPYRFRGASGALSISPIRA